MGQLPPRRPRRPRSDQNLRSGLRNHDVGDPHRHGRNRPRDLRGPHRPIYVAEDCGRLVNPMIVDGQVHGGVAQGIGAALYEEGGLRRKGPDPHREPGRLSWSRRRARSRRIEVVHLETELAERRSAASAAWAKAAPSARRRRSPMRLPMRCAPSGVEIFELLRQRRSGSIPAHQRRGPRARQDQILRRQSQE